MKRNLKEIFLEKYTKEEVDNHYELIKIKNHQNQIKYKVLNEKYAKEIETLKKYFKKVKVSLKGDGVWCNNKYGRIFIYFDEIENSIKVYN